MPEPGPLAEALNQLLSRSAKLGKISISSVTPKDREVIVTVKGRKRPAVSDRTALLTLVAQLWPGKYSPLRTKYLLAKEKRDSG